jgi:hypothetical protein
MELHMKSQVALQVSHSSYTSPRTLAERVSIFVKKKIPKLYLLNPYSTVLDKLTGLQLVKKFPAFYGTQRFNIALTSACHLSPS